MTKRLESHKNEGEKKVIRLRFTHSTYCTEIILENIHEVLCSEAKPCSLVDIGGKVNMYQSFKIRAVY